MKKIFYLCIFLACISTATKAQNRFSIIANGGYQLANITSANGSKFDYVSGARAGVAADFPVWHSGDMVLSIQPGLNFSMKGWGDNT